MVPILHVEAHGAVEGLVGPGPGSEVERLSWEELVDPLQKLNLATRCNLVVVMAACIGFAGIKALRRGPRAPAVALIGPAETLNDSELLNGNKEMYRRWQDHDARLVEIVDSSSREVGSVSFEMESFAAIAFDAMVSTLIKSLRPDHQHERLARLRKQLRGTSRFSDTEVGIKLSHVEPMPSAEELQIIWDTLFMIDLWPENRARFGVDMKTLREAVMRGAVAAKLLPG